MGVNGLTPFLQKICPAVLKNLPDRFQTLRGKRLVIDGTLITQRFHFGQNRHPYRHVLGWYKLARELEENGVSAVVLFDGKERSHAKARETERRREARRVTFERGNIEQARFQRLSKVKDAVQQYQKLASTDQKKVVNLLSHTSFGERDSSFKLLEQVPGEVVPPSPKAGRSASPVGVSPDAVAADISADDLAAQFKSLFLSYKANVAKLVTLSVDSSETAPAEAPTSSPEDESAEKVMSKFQHELSINEGEFWKGCATSLTAVASQTKTSSTAALIQEAQNRLDLLVDRSQVMVDSYERRTNAPTSTTYAQSKDILTAMGIACIEANGAIEAEALASSIVLAGHGDYVASEDTDVLVYEAPLIKNISSRHDDLIMVSGADVRTSLELSRTAYIDFALLLGTDFSQRIKNVGPQRAYKFIKELGTIERVVDAIEFEPKYSLKLTKPAYLAQVDIARLIFQTLPPVPTPESFIPPAKDEGKVVQILTQYQLDAVLHDRDHEPSWYTDALYDNALAGNYFNDDPDAA